MAETTSSNKDRMKEITDSIEVGIKELFETDKYKQYLSTMSRFHKYSVNNTMLIYMQKPDATVCAGFNKWRDQFERNVRKGERGIKIIAPTPFKKRIEENKLDPDTKLPMFDSDGKAIIEEKEIKIPMYKPVTVFDVSQTDGKPLPTLSADLTGNIHNYDVFMEALRRSSAVPIEIKSISPDLDGFFSSEKQAITIREGMSEVQTACSAVHEIAHSKLHNKELPEVKDQWKIVMESGGGTVKDYIGGFDTEEEAITAASEQDWKHVDENGFEWSLEVERDDSVAEFIKKSRNTEEVEAESISYAVCAYYGIDTGENSFGYIATWSKDKDLPELRASLTTIGKTSSELITDIDRNYAEIIKERGIDMPQETPTPEKEPITENSDGITVEGHTGTWYAIDAEVIGDVKYFLLEHEEHGDEAACVIIDSDGKLVLEDVWNGFDDLMDSVALQINEELSTKQPDNYPMPSDVTIGEMHTFGYVDNSMLPLSKEKAIQLFEQDTAVYILYEDNTEAMAFDVDELEASDAMFGISREDWEQSREYLELAEGHELTDKELENSFLNNPADAFAIYQLKRSDDTRDLRFEPLERITAVGLTVERDNYDLVYTAPLTAEGRVGQKLEQIYETFNLHHPSDFKGHSLSVSDIVALKQGQQVSSHYCDSFGFKELPSFTGAENYLKNAEMAMEDDYGMIDGIINNGSKEPTVAELEQQAKSGTPISLMDLAAASRRERESERKEKKPSVLEQLKSYEAKDKGIKTAPTKSAEREI